MNLIVQQNQTLSQEGIVHCLLNAKLRDEEQVHSDKSLNLIVSQTCMLNEPKVLQKHQPKLTNKSIN